MRIRTRPPEATIACNHVIAGAEVWLLERFAAEGPLPEHWTACCQDCAGRSGELTEDDLGLIHTAHLAGQLVG